MDCLSPLLSGDARFTWMDECDDVRWGNLYWRRRWSGRVACMESLCLHGMGFVGRCTVTDVDTSPFLLFLRHIL